MKFKPVKPSKLLTSRTTVITLLGAISAALLFASLVPQRARFGGQTPPWVERLPDNLPYLVNQLGLDNIVGSGWFAVLVSLFWISLAVSTLSQFSATSTLLQRMPSPELPQGSIRLDMTRADFSELVKTAGYRLAGTNDGVQRFIKYRIGYWGNFLLHIGLVTAVFFSLVYVVTQHRVLVRLAGQEITQLSVGNIRELVGLLPQQRRLPYSVVLKSLEPRFWGNDKLEYLRSELYFTGQPGGEPRRVDVALSDKSRFGPYIVYQASAYGRTFDLEFVSQQGETRRERLYLPYPARRNLAGYGELDLTGTGLQVKGKFYADAGRASMSLRESPLTLRLYRGKELLGETTIGPGGGGQLGPFAVRLAGSEWWTDILLDGTAGTSGIFSSFALILAGVLASYCLVPREIVVRESDGAICVQHVVRRFAPLYREEFAEIIAKAGVQRNRLKTED